MIAQIWLVKLSKNLVKKRLVKLSKFGGAEVAIIDNKKMDEITRRGKARSAAGEIKKYVPEQLAFWPDERRALANELTRSSLIHCTDTRVPRVYFENTTLFMLGEGSMNYRGEELRTRDEDIFVTLAHRAREMDASKLVVKISSSEICKINGWRQDQRYYNEIFQSIQRMKGGVITIFSRRLAKALRCQKALDAGASQEELEKLHSELEQIESTDTLNAISLASDGGEVAGMMLSLVSGEPIFTGAKSIKEGIPQGNVEWELTLDKKLVALFAKPYLTLIDFNTRQLLTATGKRLQAYFLSHKDPFAVKITSLAEMLSLKFKDIKTLKFFITEQLDELKKHNVISDYRFEKTADSKDWKVKVIRYTAIE